MNLAAPIELDEPDPIELDPRPCELCGLTIDRHEMVDDGDGPEFFCDDALDDYAAAIMSHWELADPRDAWRHTNELPPPASVRNSDIAATAARPDYYRTPQATIDAFWFVASLDGPARLAAWLADHPRDERYLQKIWEQKCSTAAAK